MGLRITIPLFLLLSVSCSNAGREPDRVAVAQAGDRMLYLDEIPAGLVVDGMSEADSISAVQSFIRQWSRKELLALKAEENLTPEYKAEVNRQLDEMRNNLLIYQYQQQMLIQKLDTMVTDSELQDYYVGNLTTFTLTSNLVKALFIKVPATAPDLDRIRALYRSTEPSDMNALEELCSRYALRSFSENRARNSTLAPLLISQMRSINCCLSILRHPFIMSQNFTPCIVGHIDRKMGPPLMSPPPKSTMPHNRSHNRHH